MCAVCGLPSALFDLFLESNVMIVGNFEICKHTCCISLQSFSALLSLAYSSSCLLPSIELEILDNLDEILWITEQRWSCLCGGNRQNVITNALKCVNFLNKYEKTAPLISAWWLNCVVAALGTIRNSFTNKARKISLKTFLRTYHQGGHSCT